MQLTHIISTTTLAALAVTEQIYAQTAQCSGANFLCSNGGGACCGPFPARFGYAVQTDDLPIGTQGWWFHGDQREMPGVSIDNCAAPSRFSYHDDKGAEHIIRIPPGQADAAEVIAQQYTNKNWQALAAYQSA